MPNNSGTAKRLTESLNLTQPPVAIAFSNSPGLERHEGHAPAGCRFWQDGTTRTFTTTAADHGSCSVGMYTHNLQQTPAQEAELSHTLAVFAELDYVRKSDLPLIPTLKVRPECIIYGPLADFVIAPAVVILYVNPAQALIASEAAQQIENRIMPAMGRPACAVVPLVVNTEMAAISLGCCGARAYLDNFTPELSIFALPGTKLAQYAERIETLARANSTLRAFHQVRRTQVAQGLIPTVEESLSTLKSA